VENLKSWVPGKPVSEALVGTGIVTMFFSLLTPFAVPALEILFLEHSGFSLRGFEQ
jgi:hypothetical protein